MHSEIQEPERTITHQNTISAHPSLLSLIGNTPLLNFPIADHQNTFLKLEYFNPGGSLKDRTAAYMIEQAEKNGLLKPGGTIIEASSGNQGIALALIGALKKYRVIVTVPTRTSDEKKKALQAYGAEVIVCERDYREHAIALSKTIENSFMPDQYFNFDNSEAHYRSTGPEIWNQTNGTVTHVVIAAGSCGTISGIGRFLKEKNPAIQIIGVDAAFSAFSSPENPLPYQAEGLGIDYVDGLFNKHVIDTIIPISDEIAFASARSAARDHGLLIGPSSGAVLHVTKQVAQSLNPDAILVAILADSGRAYLSKLL